MRVKAGVAVRSPTDGTDGAVDGMRAKQVCPLTASFETPSTHHTRRVDVVGGVRI